MSEESTPEHVAMADDTPTALRLKVEGKKDGVLLNEQVRQAKARAPEPSSAMGKNESAAGESTRYVCMNWCFHMRANGNSE